MSKNANLREKHKWAIEKPKLDNARRLRGIYFIDPEDMEFKEIIENARRKLETPLARAMPCKTCKKNKHGETRGKTDDFKRKFACILCFGKVNQNPTSNTAWKDKLMWFKSSPHYRALDTLDGAPMEFEWNIFPGFTTLQLCNKVQEFLSKKSEKPENLQDGSNSCLCSTTSHGDLKTMNRNANLTPTSFLCMREDFH